MQKTGMREHRKAVAKEYFLKHPAASIKEALIALNADNINIGERTIAQARSELAQKGLLPSGRMATLAQAPIVTEPLVVIKDTVINDKTMEALAKGDMADILDMDDESIRKELLRGVIKIALRPGVHPDTQLSATTVWSKLKDMARVAELGPGKPLTREQAIARLSELMTAVGSDIAMAAMYKAFNLKESSNEGEVPADEGAAPSSDAGPSLTPGSASDVHLPEERGDDSLGRRNAPDEHQDQG